MKKFIKTLTKNSQFSKAPENPTIEEVTDNILDLSVAIHELVRLGFTYKQINKLANGLLEAETTYKNQVVAAILSR